MRGFLAVFFLIAVLGVFVHSQALSEEVSKQASRALGVSQKGGLAQVVTSHELAGSSVVGDIAGNISADQVCISLGKFSSDPNWQLSINGESITYLGERTQELDFFVICEVGNKLGNAITFFPGDRVRPEYASHCPQVSGENRNLACLVVLTESVPVNGSDYNQPFQLFFVYAFFLLFPVLFIFKADSINLKIFNFIKVIFLILVFTAFYFIGLIISALTVVVLLFFFFVQINLSMAPIILGLADDESPFIRLVLNAVLALEVIGLIVSIILVSPFL